jgi:hypothetical protein
MLRLEDLFPPRPPVQYSPEYADALEQKYSASGSGGDTRDAAGGKVDDIVLFVVEAMMDPTRTLPYKLSEDPLRQLHALESEGYGTWGLAPGFGGFSANAEFELLTGMNMGFLPPGSVPYVRYLRGRLPSVARTLREHGYGTSALQSAGLFFYNSGLAYRLMGFERIRSVADEPGVTLDPGGRGPSDEAMVDAVTAELEASRHRHTFVFAFSGGTHWPWNYSAHDKGSIEFTEAMDLSPAAQHELKVYLNALASADDAIGRLAKYLRRRGRDTLLVVLGDHLPALSEETLDGAGLSDPSLAQHYRVPIFIWRSKGSVPALDGPVGLSNVGSYILDQAGVAVKGWWRAVGEVGRKIPTLGTVAENRRGEKQLESLRRDLEILQYKALFGEGLGTL